MLDMAMAADPLLKSFRKSANAQIEDLYWSSAGDRWSALDTGHLAGV